jgi:hypothetical protein
MAAHNAMNNIGRECYTGGHGISESSLLSMINNTGFIGTGAESSYVMGAIASALAAGALCGHDNPVTAMSNTVAVTLENIPEAWRACYGTSLPENLQAARDKWYNANH